MMKSDVGLITLRGIVLLLPLIIFVLILLSPLVYSIIVYFLFSVLTGTILNVVSSDDIRDLGEAPIPVYGVLWNAMTWPVFWTIVLSNVLTDDFPLDK